MEIQNTLITESNIAAFSSLIPPVTAERLSRKEPGLFAFGTSSDGTASCALVCRYEGSAVMILSLFAAHDFRGKGLESRLLELLKEQVRSKSGENGDIARIEAIYVPESDYDLRPVFGETGFRFIESYGIEFEVSLSRLRQSKMFARETDSHSGKLFRDLTPNMLNQLSRRLETLGMTPPPLTGADISTDLSAVITEKSEIKSLIVFTKPKKEGLTLSFAYADKSGAMTLYSLLHSAFNAISSLYEGDAVIKIPVVAKSAEALVRKLADGAILKETESVIAVLNMD